MKYIIIPLLLLSLQVQANNIIRKPPIQAQKKPLILKPCKPGEDPKRDWCHTFKKIEKKKK